MELTDEEKRLLKVLVDHFDDEDKSVRERQLRTWKQLKLLWDGLSRIWYSEVAHDWRVYDGQNSNEDGDQSAYDKPVNIFRAYLESIIAALSTLVPPVTCYPDDADEPLDLLTAKAGNKISELIYRHNNVQLLWLHALFVYCTEGMTACYSYPKDDEKYGTYEKKHYKDFEESREISVCPICRAKFSDEELAARESAEFMPGDEDAALHALINNNQIPCSQCAQLVDPELAQEPFIVTRLTGITKEPKTRICMEVYGGLYIRVANYAKKQSDTPYLGFDYETHYSLARDMYPGIRDKIGPGSGGTEEYGRWARTSTQYNGEYPINNVTVRNRWFRPAAFEILEADEAKAFKKKFPNGVRMVLIDDEFAEAENECLDDCWTLTYNPLSDHLQHDPLGLLLTSIQEITNDLVSLVLQTIEHGIPQTFADPAVLNFEAYRNAEVSPGQIFPATPKSGKSVADSFYEVKTATLSAEVLPFSQQVQNYAQLVSGAVPSLFGGQLADNKTASVYSMSRTQALQRLQSTWKIFNNWWKDIFGKVIPMYIKEMKDDEKYVEKDKLGNFLNVFIRRAELEGSIGRIELDSNENLPISWAQMKDTVMQLLQANNPQILQLIASPENLPYLYEAIGLNNLDIPGEDDRNKQYEEIKILLSAEPVFVPPDPIQQEQEILQGLPPSEGEEQPSVEVDPIFDDHQIEFDITRKWVVSDAGRLAKIENSRGYLNVLLHGKQHFTILQEQMMQQAAQAQGARTLGSPEKDLSAPISGDGNVQTES